MLLVERVPTGHIVPMFPTSIEVSLPQEGIASPRDAGPSPAAPGDSL